MSTFVGVRTLNRNRIDIGGRLLPQATGYSGSGAGVTTFLNVDNARIRRDLAKHATLGALAFGAGVPFFTADDGVVANGCAATGTATNNQITVAAGVITTAAGANVTVAGGNITLATPSTNPRLSLVAINTGSGALVEIVGAETAGLTATRALFYHETLSAITIPASRLVVAHVFVPVTPAPLAASQVLDTRP